MVGGWCIAAFDAVGIALLVVVDYFPKGGVVVAMCSEEILSDRCSYFILDA